MGNEKSSDESTQEASLPTSVNENINRRRAIAKLLALGITGAAVVGGAGGLLLGSSTVGAKTTTVTNTKTDITTVTASGNTNVTFQDVLNTLLPLAEKEGTVNVVGATEDDPFIQYYKKTWPQINMQDTEQGTNVIDQKVENEANSGVHTIDVFESGLFASGIATSPYQAYYEPMQTISWLETWRALDQKWKYFIPSDLLAYGFIWDSNSITVDQLPKTLNDLLDPKWTGKLLMRTPWVAAGLSWLQMIWAGSTYFNKDFNSWQSFLTQLKPQIGALQSDYAQLHVMVGEGQFPIALADLYSGAETYKATYPGLRFGSFSEGCPWAPAGDSLSSYAPHPNAGKLYLELMVSDVGQGLLSQAGLVPANPSAAQPADLSAALSAAGTSMLPPSWYNDWIAALTYFDPDLTTSTNQWIQKVQQVWGASSTTSSST